jgi:hypothetical protein
LLFAHIKSCGKSIILQFDLPSSNSDSEDVDEITKEFLKLAAEIEHEEEVTASGGNEGDTTEDDSDEGWVDEREEMTEEELLELTESVKPVRLLLTKVCQQLYYLILRSQLRKVAFAIKNLTTIILPQWFSVLRELEVAERMMPRDIRTRWNSTFDMLDFAVENIAAINNITSNHDMKLRLYELSEDDWGIARQLRDVLKVHSFFCAS